MKIENTFIIRSVEELLPNENAKSLMLSASRAVTDPELLSIVRKSCTTLLIEPDTYRLPYPYYGAAKYLSYVESLPLNLKILNKTSRIARLVDKVLRQQVKAECDILLPPYFIPLLVQAEKGGRGLCLYVPAAKGLYVRAGKGICGAIGKDGYWPDISGDQASEVLVGKPDTTVQGAVTSGLLLFYLQFFAGQKSAKGQLLS